MSKNHAKVTKKTEIGKKKRKNLRFYYEMSFFFSKFAPDLLRMWQRIAFGQE